MRIALVLLSFALTGCATLIQEIQTRALPPPEIEAKILGAAPPEAAPLEPGALTFSEGARGLPRGFFYARLPDGRQKIHAAAGFPTEARPNVVIGAFAASRPDARALDLIRARAAQLGATHLWRTDARSPAVFAFFVSDDKDRSPPAPKALLASERAKHRGFKKSGSESPHDLAALNPFFIETKPGRCYVLVAALSKDAVWSDSAQSMIATSLKSDDALLYNKSFMVTETLTTDDGVQLTAPSHGRYLNSRVFSHDLGCASGRSTAKVALTTLGRESALGQGTLYTQILTKKISKKETKQQLALATERRARAAAEAARFAAEARARAAEREAARARRDADDARRTAARTSTSSPTSTSSSSGPERYSFSLKNECRSTVKMFINSGGNPKFSSGESRHVSANSISSYSGFGPKTFWILDGSGNGVSSFTASSGTRNMRITSSCGGFAQR